MPVEQHMQALARADEIRIARGALKRALKAGDIRASELLAAYPLDECLRTMMPEKLLCSARRFPRKKAQQMLAEIPVGPGRNLGEMTYRQRRKLAEAVAKWEATRRHSKRAVPAHGSSVVRRSKSPRRVAS